MPDPRLDEACHWLELLWRTRAHDMRFDAVVEMLREMLTTAERDSAHTRMLSWLRELSGDVENPNVIDITDRIRRRARVDGRATIFVALVTLCEVLVDYVDVFDAIFM